MLVHFAEADIKQWWTHERFGADFQAMSQSLASKCGTMAELEAAKAERKAAPKRSSSFSNIPTPKKIKIDADICKIDEMKHTELRTAPGLGASCFWTLGRHACNSSNLGSLRLSSATR